jgi:hypothetical protein
MPTTHRAVAIVVAVIAVLGIGVLVLGAAGAPIGLGSDGRADASASAAASASVSGSEGAQPSVEAPSVSPMSEEEMLAVLTDIEAEVEAIRGLPPADIGAPEILARDEARAELEVMFAEDYPPEEREQDNLVLRAFGLLTPDQDVAELQLQLIGDSVLGYYDDDEQRMVVVSDRGLDTEAKITYAHEYTHALQDAAFDLDSLDTEAVGEDDRSLARVTLIEGDATVTMLAWAFANLSPEELQDYALGAQVPDTSGIPQWMVDQLAFPYETGLLWTGALAGSPLAPTFGSIDEAFDAPPDSTEQVMDETLDAWIEREQPIAVTAPDMTDALGNDWREVESSTVGQATIQIMLEHFGAAGSEASTAAAGWGGDRATVAYGPDDAFAVTWRTVWDTPEDAAEFAAAYEAAASDLGFPVEVGAAEGAEVLVIHASDEDVLRRVLDALG